jgi:hypothetical protein
MFKMLRLLKSNATFKRYMDTMKMHAGIMRMVTVSVSVLFMIHLMSCFWFLSAKFNDFPYDCWVFKRGIRDASGPYQYLTSVYWSF